MKITLLWVRAHIPELICALLIGGYITIFSYLSIVRYLGMSSHYYDLGIMDQVVFNTSKGRILRMTDPDIARNTSRISVHFDPLLIIFAPPYMIHPTPIILLVGQSIILGMGGLAIYLIGLYALRDRWQSLLFVFLYLNYYPMQLANLFDFHAVTIATTCILYAYYFLIKKPFRTQVINYVVAGIFVVLTLLTKENAALTVGMLFAYVAYRHSHKKLFIPLSIACGAMFFVIVFAVIPYFRMGDSFALSYFDISNPTGLLKKLFSSDTLQYIQTTLAPIGYISLLSPIHLLIALPEYLINVLSSNGNLRQVHFHYTALITPFVILSALYGYARLMSDVRDKALYARFVAGVLIFVSVMSNAHGGLANNLPSPIVKNELAEVSKWRTRLSNPNIRISTTGSIAPFFTEHRRYYYFLFDPAYKNVGKSDAELMKQIDNYKNSEYVVIRHKDIETSDPMTNAYYNDLQNNTNYTEISNMYGIEVYKNLNPPPVRRPVR